MVIETNQNGIYMHAAYASDDKGTDFSLTYFTDAAFIGNYMDRSSVESNNPLMYKWQPINVEQIPASQIEDDSEAYESVDVSNVQGEVEGLNSTTQDLHVRTTYNDENLIKTQYVQDEGLGNLNLLVGTNQGDTGWTAGSSTLASVTEAVYSEDPKDEINTLSVTLTAATDTLTFDSTELLDYIDANNEDENTYTLSYDIKVSNTGASISISVPGILTYDSPEFSAEDDDDLSDTWLHFTSTAVIASTTGTDLEFSYSGAATDTFQIANLKIEAGSMATPWRASLQEVEGIANTALSTANTAASDASTALAAAQAVNNYFWHDSSGAHVTEVTKTVYQSDPPNAGGNTLIDSTGMTIYDGTTALASFGASGAQVGQSGSGHTNVASSGLTVYGNNGSDLLANIGYGPGNNDQGTTSNAPYFSLGGRIGTVGNWSTAEGLNTTASAAYSHAEGHGTTASGIESSHAEGYNTTASVLGAHAEGSGTIASTGTGAHAEGYGTTAAGAGAHAEGQGTTANGGYSHAEGKNTTADNGGHAEGFGTSADNGGHSEGQNTVATGSNTHASNLGTKAVAKSQTTIGEYNVADPNGNALTRGDYAFIIGNGTADNARSNALTVKWNGDTTTAGDVSAVDGNFSGDVSADNVTITTDLTVGGDSTVTGDVAAGSVTTTGTVTAADIAATTAAITSNLTAGGDITATGDLSGADATLTGTMTVGRAPTSNLEVATKKYVDDNSGGGGGSWTPVYETIRNGIGTLTTTLTNYGTNNISLSNYKFIEFRVYNSTYCATQLLPYESVKAQINSAYPTRTIFARLGSTNYYFEWKYNDDTHIQARLTASGSNIYFGLFGIK